MNEIKLPISNLFQPFSVTHDTRKLCKIWKTVKEIWMKQSFARYLQSSVSLHNWSIPSIFIKNTFDWLRKCDVTTEKFFYYRRWYDVGMSYDQKYSNTSWSSRVMNFVTNTFLRIVSFASCFCELVVLLLEERTAVYLRAYVSHVPIYVIFAVLRTPWMQPEVHTKYRSLIEV